MSSIGTARVPPITPLACPNYLSIRIIRRLVKRLHEVAENGFTFSFLMLY